MKLNMLKDYLKSLNPIYNLKNLLNHTKRQLIEAYSENSLLKENNRNLEKEIQRLSFEIEFLKNEEDKKPRKLLLESVIPLEKITRDNPSSGRRQAVKAIVYERDSSVCIYCDVVLTKSNQSVDHIIPVSLGGKFASKNLVASCVNCNNERGTQSILKIQEIQNSQRKYNKICNLMHENNLVIILSLTKNNINKSSSFYKAVKEMIRQLDIEVSMNEFADRCPEIKHLFDNEYYPELLTKLIHIVRMGISGDSPKNYIDVYKSFLRNYDYNKEVYLIKKPVV